MNDSSHTHREIVAAVASLKSCLRSVVLAVNLPPAAAPSSATSPDSKIQGSVQRANDAVAKLAGLLSAVADQTLRLPLETSKRLVDVGLPDLLVQLLNACQLNAPWPAPAQAAPSADDAATGSAAGSGDSPPPAPAAEPGSTAPAALHPSWAQIQQLLQAVFSSLSVLTAVLIRACTRSHEPAMVLMQLASPAVMEAQVAYMQQLRQHAGQLQDAAGPAHTAAAAARLATESLQCAPACVAAFSSIYGLLAAATDAQAGLGELRQQLIASLCSTQLLPVAADLLLLVPAAMRPEQQQAHEVQADCQAAGWSLLTLSLFVSGAGISVCPANLNPACIQPGQPLPSSMMAASIRADADELQAQAQPLDLSIAFSAAAEPSAASLQEQLLSQPVLALLQERLYHCVTELRGSYGTSSTAFAQKQKLLRDEGAVQQLSLLPGRCCPADHDALHAALRALRCWRALLMTPAAPGLPVVGSFGVQLLLTLLAGVLAEPIKAGSSERESLRGRVIRVAVHCLQLMCSRLDQELLAEQLPALTAALAGVVSSAGAYWDSNKRAVKSEALPYTGQVRCVDKSTGDMMVRYTMAAQSALDLLRQLLLTCRAYAAGPAGEVEAGGVRVAGAMLSVGVLPALEQLFRQLPVVSPAHVTAATFLVELLPLCLHADLSAGQLPLLVTLRKFIVKSAGIAEPDREAAKLTTTQLAALLGMFATAYANSPAVAGGPADTLMQHAAVQLLPALQVYVSAELKLPIPAPYSTTLSTCTVAATAAALSSPGSAAEPARTHLLPVMLSTYQQLAALACTAPRLQLGLALLSSQVLPTVSDILSSNYWLLPGFLAAAGISNSAGRVSPAGQPLGTRGSSTGAAAGSSSSSSSSGVMFSGEHAVQLSLQKLEGLLAATAAAPQPAAEDGQTGLRGSCSSDCLCAMKRSGGADSCQIGNPKCGMHGWCCCGSPKACSDITPPATPLVASADGFGVSAQSADGRGAAGGVAGSAQAQVDLPGKQQLLLVLSRLMQSRLLPELLRVVQQLSGFEGPVVSPKPGDSAAGGFAGGFSRPGSANGLTVNVPIRRGSLQRDPRGGASPCGVSPKGAYSPLGHSAPTPAALGSSLRSQSSATQAFLTAYMGEPMPPTALGASSSSASGAAAAGLKVTANATSRFASNGCGAALPGTSPRADDGAYGLLRAGSSGSSIAWTAGALLLQEAGVRVAARDAASSGFGSSPSLASLAVASPHAASFGDSGISPFVFSHPDSVAGAAAAAVAEVGSASQLQQRLEGLLLVVAQAILAVAEAGLLGADPLPRRPSIASVAGVHGDSGLGGAGTPVEGFRLNGLPQPALSGTGSGPVPAGFSLLSAGVSKQLPSVAAGPGSLYSSYLQSTSGPRVSGSGSAPYGSVSAEDVVGSIRSCLAAAGAAAALPAGNGNSNSSSNGLSAKEEALGVSGSPIGAQQGSIRALQLSPTGTAVAGGQQQGSVAFLSAGSPVGGMDEGSGLAAESSDVIFPVELGLSQLNINTPAVGQEAAPHPAAAVAAQDAAPPCTPATPAVLGASLQGGGAAAGARQALLPVDVVRKLQGALTAAGSLLARQSGPLDSETLCPQVILAKLAPRPVGCWNASCTNMPGASESAVASKPCPSCKVASFCNKACEKQAWSEHTMACSRLAALAAAAAERSS